MPTTLGPVDPKAATRAKIYAGLATLTGVIGLLQTFNVITDIQQASILSILSGVGGLLGLGGFALATSKTNTQVKDGTFEAAPDSPVLDAFQSLNAIKAHVDDTVAAAQDNVAGAVQAIQGAIAVLPGGSIVSSAVFSGPVGDLIQAMTDRVEK